MGKNLIDSIIQGSKEDEERDDKLLEPLQSEIQEIKDPGIRSFVRAVLIHAEDFWIMPAAFDPDTHPPDEHMTGGNILHTKRVVRTALLLCESYGVDPEEKDIVIAACLLHDITKATGSEYEGWEYDPMHPYTVDAFVREVRRRDQIFGKQSTTSVMAISEEAVYSILRLIRCHMGAWSPIPETIPLTNLDMIVHIADLVSAHLHVIVDGEDIDLSRWGI